MINIKIKYILSILAVLLLSQVLLVNEVFAQAFTANTNQRSFAPRDTLVVFGKTFPNDSLIAELSNPRGARVLTTQIDAGVEGSFSRILMEWPNPNDKFPFGTYTLKLTSSISRQEKFLVFSFTNVLSGAADQERRLELQVAVPPVIGKDEVAKVIVEVLVNGVLVKGTADETLDGSKIYYPDGSIVQMNNFTALDDGLYMADFQSDMVGHHVISIQAFYQGLLATNAQGVFVEEGNVLSLGREINRVNENLEKLRAETLERNNRLEEAVIEVSQASGQVTSLLLPVIGMIVVVVVLQATILSRRGKPVNQ